MLPNQPNNDEEAVLAEMQALIKACEITDNKDLYKVYKERLRHLSGIPKLNYWGADNIIKAADIDELYKDCIIYPMQQNVKHKFLN